MLLGTLAPTAAGASDIHPIGYYTLLWAWMGAFGESIISVRVLSIAASLATVLIIGFLALDLFGPRTAVTASLLAAFSPFQVHYGQEIRMYAFMAMWLAVATYCYVRGSRTQSWGWWFVFALAAALAQYMHSLAGLYLVALAGWPVITRNWGVLRRMALAGALALALYTPWLLHLPAQLGKVDRAYWLSAPGFERLLSLFLTYVSSLPVPPAELGLALFAALSAASLVVFVVVRSSVRHDRASTKVLWLLYMAFLPPALAFAISQWIPIYVERAFLFSGAMFLIAVGWTVACSHTPQVVRGLILLLVGLGFFIGLREHLAYSGFPYAPYKQLAQMLRTQQLAGDVIVHSSKLSFLPMYYYDRRIPQTYVADPAGSSVDTLAPDTQRVLGVKAASGVSNAVGNSRRVWFLVFEQSIQEYVRAGYPRHPHVSWLMDHYDEVEVQHWGDLDLYLFQVGQ
jgi:mannosyltransferase